MSDPRVYYKALRLGDTVRSHPPVSFAVEAPTFTPTAFGLDSAMAESGASGRCSVEIEPHLIRGFSATETDPDFFARKLAFANDCRRFAGEVPTGAGTRLGPLSWVEDPTGADSIGAFAPSGLTGPPAVYNTLTASVAYGTSMADGDRLLIVEGDLYLVVTLSAAFTGGGTVIQIEDVLTADYPAFSSPSLFRLSWWLDDCAMSGDFKVGEGDKSPRVARNSTLRFDSVADFGYPG